MSLVSSDLIFWAFNFRLISYWLFKVGQNRSMHMTNYQKMKAIFCGRSGTFLYWITLSASDENGKDVYFWLESTRCAGTSYVCWCTQLLWTDFGEVMKLWTCGFEIEYTHLGFALAGAVWLGIWNSDHVVLKLSIRSSAWLGVAEVELGW